MKKTSVYEFIHALSKRFLELIPPEEYTGVIEALLRDLPEREWKELALKTRRDG